MVQAHEPVLAAAVPRGPRPGLPPRRARARRADRSAPARPPRQPRGQESGVITLWELKGKGERRYSLFSWRARMALKHKGLAFESKPVAMSDKATIAFS